MRCSKSLPAYNTLSIRTEFKDFKIIKWTQFKLNVIVTWTQFNDIHYDNIIYNVLHCGIINETSKIKSLIAMLPTMKRL